MQFDHQAAPDQDAARDHFEDLALARLKQALGPDLTALLSAPDVSEIMLNADGAIHCERQGHLQSDGSTLSPQQARTLMLTLASCSGAIIDPKSPILSCELPDGGGRFEGLLPPLARAPVFSIRRHSSTPMTLEALEAQGGITPAQLEFLLRALKERRTMLICGETGTGKTTLLNALLLEMSSACRDERVITIEDTPELCVSGLNALSLYASSHCSMSTLLRSTLRLRPDRIVMGEIRGPEALDLIDALSTGHDGGMATLHAGTVPQALHRLCLLVSRHKEAPRLIEPTVAQALDLILILKARPARHLSQVAEITGFEGGDFAFHPIPI